ncbi:MAG: flagellar hook-associated protein FlgK [Lachnospiraceae bacterium]|nr:flagellar hook-associated protein FlgK [Lachnospiraceae bacterium]
MSSTFFGLTISASGLRAANANLNTTANNISNTDTSGYSRQKVVQEAADALRTFTTYGSAGAGVETLAFERLRDGFYDNKYRSNQTKLGEYEVKEYYSSQIEDYLTDDGTTGFKTLFSSLTNSIQEVIKNAGSTSTKASFVSAAQSLTEYFNTMASNLKDMQSDVNDEVKLQVDTINAYAEQIATLNKQINVIQLSNGNANSLMDKRDAVVDALSKIVDVETSESPILDSNDPTRETGATRYLVKIAGGLTLVDGNSYNTLNCVARTNDEKTNQSDVDGLYDIYWNNGTEFSLTNGSIGGTLQGLIEMRDGNNGEYFAGKTKNVVNNGDGTHTVTIAVTDPNLKDMSKCTLSDNGGLITIGAAEFKYTDWSFDESTGLYTFTIDDKGTDSLVSNLTSNTTATVGYEVNYQGIPYYMEQMNEWIRDFAASVNNLLMGGFTATGGSGTLLMTGNKTTESAEYSETDLLNDPSGKGYYWLTASNFTISDAIVDNADLLATKEVESDGVEETNLMDDLKTLLTDKTKFSFRGSSAGEFLECLLSDVALNSSNATTFKTTYTTLQKTIENQRQSVSGVDTDEESVSLVKFQNSFNLASQMVSTFSEIYDRLILETGV